MDISRDAAPSYGGSLNRPVARALSRPFQRSFIAVEQRFWIAFSFSGRPEVWHRIQVSSLSGIATFFTSTFGPDARPVVLQQFRSNRFSGCAACRSDTATFADCPEVSLAHNAAIKKNRSFVPCRTYVPPKTRNIPRDLIPSCNRTV